VAKRGKNTLTALSVWTIFLTCRIDVAQELVVDVGSAGDFAGLAPRMVFFEEQQGPIVFVIRDAAV
jgi:hypothetical protein